MHAYAAVLCMMQLYRGLILSYIANCKKIEDGLINVTEFAKRDLIHASNFPTLMRHKFICKQAIKLIFSVLLVE